MKTLLSRADIIDGLSELVSRLRATGKPARVQIVGGAALLLSYFDRSLTVDVDGPLDPEPEIMAISAQIAAERGWAGDWVNAAATQFLPNGFGHKSAEWVTIFDGDGVVVEVASAETLLAMKLDSAQRRGTRELDDITKLLALLGIADIDVAESLYRDYYPGEEFSTRTYAIVERALATRPPSIQRPEPPLLG